MENPLKTLFCGHDFTFHGWSYVKCKKCGYTKTNEKLNARLQRQFWQERTIPNHPIFGKDAINGLIRKRGRLTHLL